MREHPNTIMSPLPFRPKAPDPEGWMKFFPSLAGVVLLRDRKQGLREAAVLPIT